MKYTSLCITIAALAANAQAGSFFSEIEDNNSLGMANDLGSYSAPGGTTLIDGAIGVSDVDWFSFTLDDSSSLAFFAVFASGNPDALLQLVTSGGDVIAFDDDSGIDLLPALQISDLAAGTYYLAISGFGDVDSSSVDSDELADGLGHQENFGYKLSVGFTVTPAPGSLALLGLGGVVMTKRRRG